MRYFTQIEKDYTILPQKAGSARVCSVVDSGDDLDEVIDSVTELAENFHVFKPDMWAHSLQEIKGDMEELSKWGVLKY